MNTSSDIAPPTPFRVGEWEVDPDSGRLINGKTEVKLEPKVMDVLVFLAHNAGKVVSRETLEDVAWAGTIVGYNAVSSSIIKLRKALGDDSRNPSYIETVSKKGYRLIAPVSDGADGTRASASPMSPATKRAKQNAKTVKTSLIAGIMIAAVIGLLIVLFGRTLDQPITDQARTPSVVVLPFSNLSGDPRHDYLSDGITDDLITDLSRVGSLRVIARQSAYHYKDNPAGLEDIARHLGVTYIVEGSVRKVGNHIRINVQLTDTHKGESIWAQRFEADTDNIFKVQDDITRKVMDAMYITLSGTQLAPIDTRGTKNFAAYDAFLVGQQHIRARSRSGYELAMKAYRRAIEIDPNYARAYGAMAVTLTRGYRYQWGDLSLVEARERALVLAKKAIELNSTTPQIYWSLGYVHLHRREYDEAEKAAEKSIALSPNYADGYALLANIANWRGKARDAVTYIKKATALNPYYSFQYPSTLGTALYNLGHYKEAAAPLKEALIRNESAINPRLYLAAVYIRLDQKDEALWEIEQVKANRPDITLSTLGTRLPYEHVKDLDTVKADLRRAGLPE